MRAQVLEWYPQWEKKLRRYLRFKARYSDPDEIMQNVWLDVLRLEKPVEFPQQFLRTTVMREFLNWKDKRTKPSESNVEIPVFDSVESEIEARILLDALSPREREAMIAWLIGETASEIGHRLGVTTETVRTHLKHGLRKLRGRAGTAHSAIDLSKILRYNQVVRERSR